jgi:hypothetical protein
VAMRTGGAGGNRPSEREPTRRDVLIPAETLGYALRLLSARCLLLRGASFLRGRLGAEPTPRGSLVWVARRHTARWPRPVFGDRDDVVLDGLRSVDFWP